MPPPLSPRRAARINIAAPTLVPRRFYSTDLDSSSNDFDEWLRGFTDEGCFRIKDDSRRPKSPFTFEFIINLHKDDRKALEYIKSILDIGNVNERGKFATFSVSRRIEVKVLIDIFSKFTSPLGHPNKNIFLYVLYANLWARFAHKTQPQASEV